MKHVIANRYRIIHKLGEGGMGTVYKADDRLSGDTVAVKQIRMGAIAATQTPPTVNKNETLLLAQEFQTLASLHHPHIVGVLDYGFEDNQPYFTMQYLADARSIVAHAQAQSPQDKVRLLIELLQALTYIHRRGIVHRDIKPGNVLAMPSGTVKLLDFGLATEVNHNQPHVGGTLPYIAPEVLAGESLTSVSDLYSVGVLAFEMFTGKTPFQHLSNIDDVIQAILYTYPDFTAFELDERLVLILERLLEKSPRDRYENAQAVIRALVNAFELPTPDESSGIRDSFLQSAAFVGRETELFELQTALKTVRTGQGSAWLIGGESGVGKSRLLDELRIHALTAGVAVLQGQGVEGGGFPFQLWRDMLRRVVLSINLMDLEASVLKAIVPDISTLIEREIKTAPVLEGDAGQQRLIRTIVDVIRRYCQDDTEPRPVLLILEDLQWAIESLEPLKLLNREVRNLPLMIVGNYRDDERASLPEELPMMNLIKLERLSDNEIATLTQQMIGAEGKQPDLLAFLRQETEGNVFFLIEVMRVLADEAGRLDDIGQVALPQKVLPETIQQISQQRLAKLPSDYLKLLQLAAILGRQIDTRVMQRFAGEANIALDNWLIVCAQSAILELRDGIWRFLHDKLRESTLRTLPQPEVPLLYQRVAEVIESLYPDDRQYTLLLINLWREAQNPIKELHYLVREGIDLTEHAGFNSYRQAHEIFKRGWELHEHADKATQLDLILGMGLSLVGTHQYEDAKSWFKQAIELAEELQQPAKKSWALNGLARSMLNTAPKDELYPLLDEAVSLSQSVDDKLRLSDVLVTKGYIQAFHRDFEESATTFEQAGDLLRKINHEGWLAMILNNVGKLKQLVGEYPEARQNLEEARTLALQVQYFNTAVLSTSNLGILAYFTEQYPAAVDYYTQSIQLMKTHDDIAGLSHVWVLKLFAQADMEDMTAAQDSLRQAIRDRHDSESIFSNIYIVMGGVRLTMDDDPAQAAAWLGLLYHLSGDDPFIREWLDPLRERFLDTLDETVLEALMKKGHTLELNAVVREVEESTQATALD